MNVYITDAVKAIADTMANAFSGETVTHRWYQLRQGVPEEEQNADEVIEDIGYKLDIIGAQ